MMRIVLVGFLVSALLFVGVQGVGARRENENTNDKGRGLRLEKVEKRTLQTIEKLEKIELPDVESPREVRSSLFVGPVGEARIHGGEITALSGASFSVKVWALTLSVETATTTRFIPAGTEFSSLRIGDKVNVAASMRETDGVLVARIVHDLSGRGRLAETLASQIRQLIERLREIQTRLGLPLTPFPETSTMTPQSQ